MAACPGRSWQARLPGASARRAWTYLIWARFQRLWRILQRTSRWKAAASIRASWSLAATIRLNTMASKWCCAARRCTVNASRHCASGLNRKISAPGWEVRELFCEVDGRFPNHHPDPAQPENLRDVIQTLAESEAQLGFAFDG